MTGDIGFTCQPQNLEQATTERARRELDGARSRRRRRAEAAGGAAEPVRAPGARCAAPQGAHGLRVRRGGPRQQERPAPRLQPRPQEGPRAHPRRQARLRVHAHRAVPRRGLPRRRTYLPPRRPLPPRRRPLLGRLRRRQLLCLVVQDAQGEDGRGEGGGDGGHARGAADAGGRLRGVLQGEGLLRRRRARVHGRRAGGTRGLDAREREGDRREPPGRRPDPAPGGVGGPLRGARRRQGGHPGRRPDRRVRQGDVCAIFCCCSTSCEQLRSGNFSAAARCAK